MVPAQLTQILAAMTLSPVTALAAPSLAAALAPITLALRPDVMDQLAATHHMHDRKQAFLAAVQQLASTVGNPTVATACCRDVKQLLPALYLLTAEEASLAVDHTLTSLMVVESPQGPAVSLLTALLQHPSVHVCQAAFSSLASRTADSCRPNAAQYLLQPEVAAAVILVGGFSVDRALQEHTAAALASLLAGDNAAAGTVYAPWEPWLSCLGESLGPTASSLAQLICAAKTTTWEWLQPTLMDLFSKDVLTACAAATTLLSVVVKLQLPAGSYMQRASQPFEGMLVPAAGSSVGSTSSSSRAAALFSTGDVEGLLHVIRCDGMPPELVADALGQLAHITGQERFHPLLMRDEGIHVECSLLL